MRSEVLRACYVKAVIHSIRGLLGPPYPHTIRQGVYTDAGLCKSMSNMTHLENPDTPVTRYGCRRAYVYCNLNYLQVAAHTLHVNAAMAATHTHHPLPNALEPTPGPLLIFRLRYDAAQRARPGSSSSASACRPPALSWPPAALPLFRLYVK